MSRLLVPLTAKVPTRGVRAQLRWWTGKNRWGRNPDGRPLYRVIWAPTRTYLLGGCWPDGAIEYRHVPYYPGVKRWVLEKWLSPLEYAGTERDWNAANIDVQLAAHGITVQTMGPYPARGWYEHCFTFPEDAEPNLELIVPLLEQTATLTFQQIKDGIRLRHELARKEWEQKVMDGIHEAQPAFGWKPTSVSPSKPHADTGGLLNHADELKRAVGNYVGEQGEKPAGTPDELQLPERGFSMPQRRK